LELWGSPQHRGRSRWGSQRTNLIGRVPRCGVEVRGGARECEQLVEVELVRDLLRETVECVCCVIALGGRHESEVARGRDDAVVALQDAEHRQTGGLERPDDFARM